MKRVFICIISISIIFSGCRTTVPINEDDISVNIQLHQSFMHPHTCGPNCKNHHHSHYYHHDYVGFHFGFYGTHSNNDDTAFLVFLLIIISAGWYFGSTRMYIAPEDHETDYTQQLYWGDNKVFLPKAAAEEEGSVLIMETFGSIRKKWRYPFKPEKNKYIILKESSILEKFYKPMKIPNKSEVLHEMENTEEELRDLGIRK